MVKRVELESNLYDYKVRLRSKLNLMVILKGKGQTKIETRYNFESFHSEHYKQQQQQQQQ